MGVFAFIIGNFNHLSQIVFQSFSGLGLKAAGSSLSADDFLHPGKIAQAGIDAGAPILQAAAQLTNFVSFFENFIQIIVLLIGWVIVIIAFFILAVQLFVTLIEFKLTTLAGFVLVPFGLFGRNRLPGREGARRRRGVRGEGPGAGSDRRPSARLCSPSSSRPTAAPQPTLEDVLALALASLCLMGLGIFGPGIATGLVSGAPQLGAGRCGRHGHDGRRTGGRWRHGGVGCGQWTRGPGRRSGLRRRRGHAGQPRRIGRRLPRRWRSGTGRFRSPAAVQVRRPATLVQAPSRAWPLRRRPVAAAASPAASSGSDGGAASAPAEPPEWAKSMRRSQAMHRGAETAAHAIGVRSWRRRIHQPRPLGGLRMTPFKRAGVRYGRTPQPETPYQRAPPRPGTTASAPPGCRPGTGG